MRSTIIAAMSLLAIGCAKPAADIFSVSYADDVPVEAQAAFNEATAIWSQCLANEHIIKVHVDWIERGPTGFAYVNAVRNENYLPVDDAWYPTALANVLAGERVSDDDDMNIFFSARTNWRYNDGEAIGDEETDFINVALHEIAHGLGLTSGTFIPWDRENYASMGVPNDYVNFFSYTFPLHEQDGTPFVYDTYIRTGNGEKIVDVKDDPAALLAALSDDGLHFHGEKAKRANNGERVLVETQSVTHIPAQEGKETPIMLGNGGVGERIQTLDPVLLGILEDLGWQINESCKR